MTVKTSMLWSFFSSVKLTIVLFIVLIALFILGTFIPQQGNALTFASHFSPLAQKVFHALQLFDIYHSLLFYAAAALLSLNLIICSLNRFPRTWQQYRAPLSPAPESLFKNIELPQILVTDKTKESTIQIIEPLLKKYCRTIERNDTGAICYVGGERGKFSIFGVYVVHLSILMLLAGGIIGSISGFDGYLRIDEGESANLVLLRDGTGSRKLDFLVRCDKFTVEYYADGTPRTYRSDLSFIKDGSNIRTAPLLVNHPITVDNIRFYQASYGELPGNKAVITFRKRGAPGKEITGSAGNVFAMPDIDTRGEILRIEENIMEMGPAVKIRITSRGKDIQFWVFKNIDQIVAANPDLFAKVPMVDPGFFKPYLFTLNKVEHKYYTGLQVVQDFSTPFIIAGGCILVAGLLIIFFTFSRRVWVMIAAVDGNTEISIAGRSSRNQARLKQETDRLCEQIREKIKA